MSSLQVYQQITNPLEWGEAGQFDQAWLQEIASLVLQQVSLSFPAVELSFLFTDDATIQNYNKTYRGKDQATNVLSFPSYTKEDLEITLTKTSGRNPPSEPLLLGDVALAFETIEREAQGASIPFSHHLSHLLIHGILHLLGYDHEEEGEATLMEALEIRILSYKGIPNPYKSCQNLFRVRGGFPEGGHEPL